MAANTRLKVGVIFNFSRSWLGGVYYIINLIRSLNSLEEVEQPEITVFYKKDLEPFLKEIDYPHLQTVETQFPPVAKGYLQSLLSGKNLFVDHLIRHHSVDALYPVMDQPVSSRRSFGKGIKIVAWYPDLQHKFYPAFFSRKQWWMREARLRLLVRNATDLVVSSEDAARHFRQFYRLHEDLQLHVLRFASLMDQSSFETHPEVVEQYGLSRPYFMVSNQFHNHKNHLAIWRAVQQLKAAGQKVTVAVTGKMENVGNDAYIRQLRAFLEAHQLEEQIRLLGVIPREDQLKLMKQALAIIQPSLFEGWSTVIEDAKSLQVPVIASNLPVHQEQLGSAGRFFDPQDRNGLADRMREMGNGQVPEGPLYETYDDRVREVARRFLEIVG